MHKNMEIRQGVNLAQYTTFKVGGPARYFVAASTVEDLRAAINFANKERLPLLILGGGSNTIISDKGFNGLVIKNELKGIRLVKDAKSSVLVEAAGGEIWSALVNYCVEHGYYGLENLFLIPGTVGAAPVQNIGAYGAEFKDTCYRVKAINLQTGKLRDLSAAECHFGYRNSIFKNRWRGKWMVVGVTAKLNKKARFNLEYGAIKEKLAEKKIKEPTARQLVEAIMAIRNSKLPNPAVLPNAGSFFKNPEVTAKVLQDLKRYYPDLKTFLGSHPGLTKIPAGWLIEQCGFKGKDFGPVGVYEHQALVLVNRGGATQKQIVALADKIIKSVQKKFEVELEVEVNIV
jgi:UDP-N-acetylmuramate dehydrogenase